MFHPSSRNLLATFVMTGCLAAGIAAADEPEPVLFESFDAVDPSELHDRLDGHDRMQVVEGEGVDGSKALKVDYVGYDRGSKRQVVTHGLGVVLREATLSYDVKFDEDFQFVRGGKLHGLGPKVRVTGGNPRRPDRWSARVNFRAEGGVSTYLYDQSEGSRWGRSVGSDGGVFEKGRYHAVSMHMRVNDADDDNGFARIYIDGELVVEHEDVRFRGEGGEHTRIHAFLLSTFHGGSSPRWAPKDENGDYVTVHAWFDNFAVHPGKTVRSEPGER